MKTRTWGGILLACVGLASCGCERSAAPGRPAGRLRLATTTSTENSGLLADLLAAFRTRYGIRVDVIAVGTGKALKLAENGDVDAVLVHAPEAEIDFVRRGFGVNRRAVMYNTFLIAGPREDGARVREAADVGDALRRIAAARSFFVSRGDDSGTHRKERALWALADLEPGGSWYIETGQSMGASLLLASEKDAYLLTDRGTYLAFRSGIELVPLFSDSEALYNPYGIIAVNPARYPEVRYVEAMTLIGWLTSPEGQRAIAAFRVEGEMLFHPLAVPRDDLGGGDPTAGMGD